MKKIVSLLLCLVMACSVLVGCAKEEIGDHVPGLKEQFYVEPEATIDLKLYVIYDEADEGALTEVERRINALTEADYNTRLDVVYLTADDYDAAVMEAAKKSAEGKEQAIVLINSEELMLKLYDGGKDITVTEYFDPTLATADAPVVKVVTHYTESGSTVTKYDSTGKVVAGTAIDEKKIPISKQISVGYLEEVGGYILPQTTGDAKYGLLNAKIATSLLDASKLPYNVLDKNGNLANAVDKNGAATDALWIENGLFSVPNNHLIDGTQAYTYLKIDRQACEIWLNYSVEYLRGITSIEKVDALKAELRDVLTANGQDPDKADEYVQFVRGSYATKAQIEDGEKFVANVFAAPQVTTEDAFSGAFAVLKGTDVDRAMRIIYALNMDSDLHNLLQYGIKDTNYNLDKNGVVSRFGDEVEGKKYHMNLLYTGGVFKLTGNVYNTLYCIEENFTAEIAAYMEEQNKVADKQYVATATDEAEYLALKDAAEKMAADIEAKAKDLEEKEKTALEKEAIAQPLIDAFNEKKAISDEKTQIAKDLKAIYEEKAAAAAADPDNQTLKAAADEAKAAWDAAEAEKKEASKELATATNAVAGPKVEAENARKEANSAKETLLKAEEAYATEKLTLDIATLERSVAELNISVATKSAIVAELKYVADEKAKAAAADPENAELKAEAEAAKAAYDVAAAELAAENEVLAEKVLDLKIALQERLVETLKVNVANCETEVGVAEVNATGLKKTAEDKADKAAKEPEKEELKAEAEKAQAAYEAAAAVLDVAIENLTKAQAELKDAEDLLAALKTLA